jgi:hypothetical protein
MTLQVIGSGFGRTGTMSLKLAIEQLGIGRCYHMMEVFQLPNAPTQWLAAANGAADWPGIFEGFSATVDWPNATFYRELADAYPEAKVIHTERDADQWFDSVQSTIYPAMVASPPGAWRDMAQKVIFDLFDDKMDDRDHAIGVFRRHNEAVRKAIPADRLLVYEVSQGWEPLCAFLGAAVPATPMPKVNSREEFAARLASARPTH